MEVFRNRQECLDACKSARKAGAIIGLVPTMGALHDGHLSLIRAAMTSSDYVMATVFVNPNQFNNPDDLHHYPRDESGDLRKLEACGCHSVYIPGITDVYPDGAEAEDYHFGHLSEVMEGPLRPGHFNGVATVVERFLRLIEPSHAFFGEKDYQQLCIIRSLVNQKELSIDIHGCPIIREDDGLAMSSRNQLLSPEERKAAPFVFQQLCRAREAIHTTTFAEIKKVIRSAFAAHPLFRLEYFEIADAGTLLPMDRLGDGNPRGFVVAYLGSVRLIDNLPFID